MNKNNQSTGPSAWHGLERETIDWAPTIAADRCVGCGMCVLSCGRRVYGYDYERKLPVVTRPDMCMVGCTTCSVLCLQDAIEFPPIGYVRGLIREHKLVSRVRARLRDEQEQFRAIR